MPIPELGDAYLWHSMSCAGANNYVYTMLSVYGKTPAEVETIRAKWQPWLEQCGRRDAQRGVTGPAYNRRAVRFSGPPPYGRHRQLRGVRARTARSAWSDRVEAHVRPRRALAGDLFFALIAGDVLYLKADEATRNAREKAGARPFQPFPIGRKKGRMQSTVSRPRSST